MSPRMMSRWVRARVALAVIAFLHLSGSALAQVREDESPSVLRLGSEGQPPSNLTTAAIKAIDCGATSAASASSCLMAAPEAGAANAGGQAIPGVLTLRDAIQRALEHNLTILGFTHAVGEQRGQERVALSRLLPNITTEFSTTENVQNLAARGVTIDVPIPGFVVNNKVGPFTVFDLRAFVSQSLVDIPLWRNLSASREALRASELSLEDARDLITLTVARAYVQAQSSRARLESTRAQVNTARANQEKAALQRAAGLVTPLDLNRINVQMLMAQQRLTALEATFAKQKIDLTRIAGLPPTDRYDLDPSAPFSPGPQLTLEQALKEAFEGRADLRAAEAQVRAAEFSLSAVRAERLPRVTLRADYGPTKADQRSKVNTYLLEGLVSFPIWEGGRIGGHIQNAVSTLNRRRAERDDLRAQIEADVRKAYVDLEAAATGVRIAELNVEMMRETFSVTRQRLVAGVSDNVTVVRSQESMSTAEFDYIDSVLVHNLAKLDVARAIGGTVGNIDRFLGLPGR